MCSSDLAAVRRAFQKHYKTRTGRDVNLQPIGNQRKRADFVLQNQDQCIHLIEIKASDHALENAEMDRIDEYNSIMLDFLNAPGHEQFRAQFPEHQITIVCDKLALKGVQKTAFEGLKKEGLLVHMTWEVFLKRAKQAHQDFLAEADKQRRLAGRGWVEE